MPSSLKDQPDVKILPYSYEAEQSVIGALMLDNKSWDRIVDRIASTDFYRKEHRYLFEAIETLAKKSTPFDVLLVTDLLKSQGKLEHVGGESYIYTLANNTPSSANAEAYADVVRERSILRQLISASSIVSHQALSHRGQDVQLILDQAEKLIFQISVQRQRGEGPQKISSLLAKAADRVDTLYHSDAAITGLATGFKDFDELTSGLQEGELTIIAGRPAMGKTTFALNIAQHAALLENTKPVLVFSLEMPGDALAMRMLSAWARIDQLKLRTGKFAENDWPRFGSAVGALSEAKLYIDDTPSLSPVELRSRARRLAREHDGLSVIVIDYIQLMQIPGIRENRTAEISEISRSLKALAKELNIPVIGLSQLNRSLEQRHDKRPVMSDLRESGALEQDADLIVFIYRDEVYHEDTMDRGIAEIIVGKHRNGPVGKVKLTFLGQFTRFENFSSAVIQ
jgi:replicative DNA helicase